MSETPVEHPVDYFDYTRTGKSRRNYVFPIALIIILLTAIAAATYFGFFYKPGDLSFLTNRGKKQPVAISKPVVTTPVVTDTTKPVRATPRDPSAAVVPMPAQQTPPPAVSSDKPIARMAQTFAQLSAMIPSTVNVTTMVLDESSFSIEVSAESKAAIENLFTAVHNQWASDLSFSPSAGSAAVRGLITGLLTSPGSDRAGSSVNPQTVVQELERAAKAAELKVIEITEIKNMNQNSARRTPIFIKVRGTRAAFQMLCASAANQDWNLRVGKFILLNSQGESATFVLRLELMPS